MPHVRQTWASNPPGERFAGWETGRKRSGRAVAARSPQDAFVHGAVRLSDADAFSACCRSCGSLKRCPAAHRILADSAVPAALHSKLNGTMRTGNLITVAYSLGSTVLLHRVAVRSASTEELGVGIAQLCNRRPASARSSAGRRGARHLRHRPGPVAAWIAVECTLLALAGFWFLLPLRERGSQDTAQPGL